MRDFLRLTWKEVRELVRPKYLLPILMTPLLFVAMGAGFGGVQDQLDDEPVVGVIDQDDGEYGEIVAQTYEQGANVTYSATSGDAQDALATVRDRDGSALVVIPPDFTERIQNGEPGNVEIHSAVDAVSLGSIGSASQVDSLLSAASQRITMAATGASPAEMQPIDPSYTTDVKGTVVEEPPSTVSDAFSVQLFVIPMVIVFVIFFSGQMVTNAMGLEKENKTLETLLTMPVNRRTIVGAKLAGSAVIGLIVAVAYTGSLYYYQNAITGGGGSTASAFALGGLDYVLVGISLALALIGALALSLCLGVFVEDRQAAQMLLFPLGLLVFVPFLAVILADFTALSLPLQAVLFSIPFTHPVMAPKQLMFGDTGLILAGILYETLFAVGAIGLAVWLFNSDRLVTGSTGRIGQLLERMQR
ncbi:ABC transporter permease [Halobacteriales archaeon Cl-PHB]